MKKGKGRAACASDAPEKPWLAMADRRVGVCSHRNELCGDARGLEGLQLGQPRGREARRDGVSDGEQHRRVPPAASSPSAAEGRRRVAARTHARTSAQVSAPGASSSADATTYTNRLGCQSGYQMRRY